MYLVVNQLIGVSSCLNPAYCHRAQFVLINPISNVCFVSYYDASSESTLGLSTDLMENSNTN